MNVLFSPLFRNFKKIYALTIILLMFGVYPLDSLLKLNNILKISTILMIVVLLINVIIDLEYLSFKKSFYNNSLVSNYSFYILVFIIISTFINPPSYFYMFISFFLVNYLYKFNSNYFKKILTVILIVQLILMTYEWVAGSYFYTIVSTRGNLEYELNETFFGGSWGIFRAKGLFPGPLTASLFAIYTSILFREKWSYLVLAILVAVLANARLGIFVTSLVLLLNLSSNKNKTILYTSFLFIVIISILLFADLYNKIFLSSSFTRFLLAFSSEDSGNIGRMYYLQQAMITYFQYDNPLYYFFGNTGYYFSKYLNSAESGWMTLLVETGLFGLLIYLIPLIKILKLAINLKKVRLIFIIILLFVSLSFVSINFSIIGTIFYWFTLFDLNNVLKKNINFIKIDKINI